MIAMLWPLSRPHYHMMDALDCLYLEEKVEIEYNYAHF